MTILLLIRTVVASASEGAQIVNNGRGTPRTCLSTRRRAANRLSFRRIHVSVMDASIDFPSADFFASALNIGTSVRLSRIARAYRLLRIGDVSAQQLAVMLRPRC